MPVRISHLRVTPANCLFLAVASLIDVPATAGDPIDSQMAGFVNDGDDPTPLLNVSLAAFCPDPTAFADFTTRLITSINNHLRSINWQGDTDSWNPSPDFTAATVIGGTDDQDGIAIQLFDSFTGGSVITA